MKEVIFGSLFGIAVWYLIIAFINFDTNPANWGMFSRFVFAGLAFFSFRATLEL